MPSMYFAGLLVSLVSCSCGSAGALGISTGSGASNPTNQVVTWSCIDRWYGMGSSVAKN